MEHLKDIDIDGPISEVLLSGLVVLKIIQHCRQHLPVRVTGHLLGLDIRGVLEITDSFMVASRTDEEKIDIDYEVKMLQSLREVNVDNISVGWYISSFLGQHHELPELRSDVLPFLVNTQFQWQSDIPNSVVLIYDHLASSHGSLSLKAFRLTKTFMDLYKGKEKNFTRESLAKNQFSFKNIFEEVPVKITNSGIASVLLYHLETDDAMADQFESLDLGADDFFEKNLESLLSCFSELQVRQNAHQQWLKQVQRHEQAQNQFLQKRKSENIIRQANGLELLSENIKELEVENPSLFKKIPEPWKPNLEMALLSNRIDEHCQQISTFAAQALLKNYLANLTEQVSK